MIFFSKISRPLQTSHSSLDQRYYHTKRVKKLDKEEKEESQGNLFIEARKVVDTGKFICLLRLTNG